MDESKSDSINSELLAKRVHVAVAGVGGNGAQVVALLARLNLALLALGHPHGLYVLAYDPDTVSEANVGRQLWSPSDVGENKAIVAIERTNLFYGLDWDAEPALYTGEACDILISCVDTRGARQSFAKAIQRGLGPRYYWLDMGNEESIGQCCLGEVTRAYARRAASAPRLPLATELFPALSSKAKEDNTHSCSLRISLQSQGLFVNDFVARCSMQILYKLFTKGRIGYHGAFLNLESLRMSPIPIDPVVWGCIGYAGPAEERIAA
ncbi:MAG: PRTRC system ThiF family protein [Sterolibacteriaceae bacterium]|uniref:PRTRC system ThiF family protein n=1 Tax=Candidatus Methylophosphatis roskildensis TaxID=2899263 RepID=A0A9D7HSK8_9PROT|nr:PRTRC system ThiF family protein [Candidatus Methylophosphatis roskildensis]